MDVIENWRDVKAIFRESFQSSLHYAIATVDANNCPHITPIGSLILGAPGHGIYFEEFTQHLPKNLEANNSVCVLAVNSSRWFWLKSLLGGKFSTPPAIRLYGKAGQVRDATAKEIQLWQRRVKSVRFSKGHQILWRDMKKVRDIEFTKIQPVQLGKMTPQLMMNVPLGVHN